MHLPSGNEIGGSPSERTVREHQLIAIAQASVAPATSPASGPLTAWAVLSRPLPFKGLGDRAIIRAITLAASRQVRAVHGLENVLAARDPFILAVGPHTKRASLLVPAVLIFHRGGRLIHFWSDWFVRLIPGLALVLRRAGTIVVTGKSPRWRMFNAFKRFYLQPLPAVERARIHLAAGRSVGVFPEGAVNRDPRRLLPARIGTARLSLETGVPIVPVGIRFPEADPERPIPESATVEIHIGSPLRPPAFTGTRPPIAAVREWNAAVMAEIARLSGQPWPAASRRANGSARIEK